MQGLSLGVQGSGLVRWVSCRIRGKLGKCHVHSGNVHAGDCGSTHCSGSMAFLLRQHDEYYYYWKDATITFKASSDCHKEVVEVSLVVSIRGNNTFLNA